MPFEFKPQRTPRQAQADMVKRRVHMPALAQPSYKPPDLLKDFKQLTPLKIGGLPPAMSFRTPNRGLKRR